MGLKSKPSKPEGGCRLPLVGTRASVKDATEGTRLGPIVRDESHRVSLGGLLSSRAHLRFAGCSQFAMKVSGRSRNFQRPASSVLTACLSSGGHRTTVEDANRLGEIRIENLQSANAIRLKVAAGAESRSDTLRVFSSRVALQTFWRRVCSGPCWNGRVRAGLCRGCGRDDQCATNDFDQRIAWNPLHRHVRTRWRSTRAKVSSVDLIQGAVLRSMRLESSLAYGHRNILAWGRQVYTSIWRMLSIVQPARSTDFLRESIVRTTCFSNGSVTRM